MTGIQYAAWVQEAEREAGEVVGGGRDGDVKLI